jgi:type IV pilus assembly protein PilN
VNVSIDLLPQARRDRLSRLPLLIGTTGLFLLIATLLISLYITGKNSVEELDQQITTKTQTRDTLLTEISARRNGVTEYNFVDKYELISSFLNGVYKNPISLKKDLDLLLPEGGSVSNYTFDHTGTLSMTIQFSTKEEAATYLENLLIADFVTEAKVTSITLNAEKNVYEANYEAQVVTLEGEQK